MHTRNKLRIVDGWPDKHVEYSIHYEDGHSQIYLCSINEWRAWEIKQQMVEAGIDEKLTEELYSLGYKEGCLESEIDYDESSL